MILLHILYTLYLVEDKINLLESFYKLLWMDGSVRSLQYGTLSKRQVLNILPIVGKYSASPTTLIGILAS